MKGWNEKTLWIGLIAFLINCAVCAQDAYSVDSVGISITGASTLHDWKVVASEITEYPEQIIFNNSEGRLIEAFHFKVKVASMDGGRGAAMNKKIFKALKSDTYPNIEFSLSKPTEVNTEEPFLAEGVLSIAGHSQNISLSFEAEELGEHLIFSGSHPLKMSEFKIDPPSAMFGQIQTKDEIEVRFTFKYKKG